MATGICNNMHPNSTARTSSALVRLVGLARSCLPCPGTKWRGAWMDRIVPMARFMATTKTVHNAVEICIETGTGVRASTQMMVQASPTWVTISARLIKFLAKTTSSIRMGASRYTCTPRPSAPKML